RGSTTRSSPIGWSASLRKRVVGWRWRRNEPGEDSGGEQQQGGEQERRPGQPGQQISKGGAEEGGADQPGDAARRTVGTLELALLRRADAPAHQVQQAGADDPP